MANHEDVSGLPVDKGWAWMVLLGSTSMLIIFDGVFRSSGLFILQYQMRFNSNTSETTLVLTLFMIMSSVAGVFVMTVGMKYMSVRTSACVGGFLVSACYAISAFSEHIEILIVFVGAVTGAGAVMIWLPMLSAIGTYFERRRGLANSVTASGASIGALAFGPFYTMLFDYYGYTGTMLLASGILLNIVAAVCLIRPPEFYTRSKVKAVRKQSIRRQFQPEEITTRILASEKVKIEETGAVNGHARHIDAEILTAQSTDTGNNIQFSQLRKSSDTVASTKIKDFEVPLLTSGNISDRARNVLVSSGSIFGGSLLNVNVNGDEKTNITIVTENDNEFCNKSTSVIKVMFDIGLLKDPVFIHYTLFSMIAVAPCFMNPLFLVPFASDIGISNQRIGMLMFVLGGMDLVGRLCIGFLLDKKVLRSTTIMAIAFLIMAVMDNLLRLVKHFEVLVAFAVIQGCLSGQFFAVFAVILIEHIGPSQFQSALGFTNLFQGFAAGICIPITGMLRDVTGAYYWTYHMLGGLLIVAAILAFTLPYTHKKHQRIKADTSSIQITT